MVIGFKNIKIMIRFFTETSFKKFKRRDLNRWIKNTILNENKKIGEVNVIFCDDEYLLSINRQYLNHNYFTDVISFDNSTANIITGDIYISIDTVKKNAADCSVDFSQELRRVVIHGVLHFIGYNDKKDEQVVQMRLKEDYYLSLYGEG